MIAEYKIRALPIAGARLVRFRFCGNGKDAEATIEVEGARKVTVPLADARMDLSFSGPVTMRTRGYGDTAAVIEVLSTSDHPVIVDDAAILFPGNDGEWDEFLQSYAKGEMMLWCVELRLRLVAM
jgi:hypothetical protein